jgi:hypothetical protein
MIPEGPTLKPAAFRSRRSRCRKTAFFRWRTASFLLGALLIRFGHWDRSKQRVRSSHQGQYASVEFQLYFRSPVEHRPDLFRIQRRLHAPATSSSFLTARKCRPCCLASANNDTYWASNRSISSVVTITVGQRLTGFTTVTVLRYPPAIRLRITPVGGLQAHSLHISL